MLDDILKEQTALAIKIQEFAKSEFKSELLEAAKNLFSASDKIEAVKWPQYTPYFNDGDSCVFNVYEPAIVINGATANQYDLKDNDPDKKTIDKFTEFLYKAVDILEVAFGDSVEVTIDRNLNLTVEDYDHD